jgi:hypothetical protein
MDSVVDPDKKWIGTWNDCLQSIEYLIRWLHNSNNDSLAFSERQTPLFAQIKKKKANRLSPYAESELWEREDLLAVVKY